MSQGLASTKPKEHDVIYALLDPRELGVGSGVGSIRFISKTKEKYLNSRTHVRRNPNNKQQRIKELRDLGIDVECVLLEVLPIDSDPTAVLRDWIIRYKNQLISFGPGSFPRTEETRGKMRAARIGKSNHWRLGKPLSQKTKKKISDKRKISNLGFKIQASRKTSSLETTVAAFLDSRKLPYVPQYSVGRFFCDLYLPDFKLDIECDGEYWHSRPGAKERDVVKDTFLISEGVSVLRLPEKLIRDKESLYRELDMYFYGTVYPQNL